MRHSVFVYGTLKRGCHNNHYLKTAKFIGEAETVDKMHMTDIGYPLVDDTKPTTTIKGELWEVDDKTLRALDRLEGHPRYYQRMKKKILVGGVLLKDAFMYINRNRFGEDVPNGCWRPRR